MNALTLLMKKRSNLVSSWNIFDIHCTAQTKSNAHFRTFSHSCAFRRTPAWRSSRMTRRCSDPGFHFAFRKRRLPQVNVDFNNNCTAQIRSLLPGCQAARQQVEQLRRDAAAARASARWSAYPLTEARDPCRWMLEICFSGACV